jgi:RHS repeat-associated protein
VLRDENKDADGDCVDGTDERLYYLQDAQGAVTALANASGTIVERVMYDAYGKSSLFQGDWTTTQSSSVYSNEILYAGYRLNPETGMYQVRHREYHPTLGRWLTRDPLGYHDGPNLYEYVGGLPADRFDPTGQYAQAGWGNPYGMGINQYLPNQPWGQVNVVSTITSGPFAGTIVDGPASMMASSPNAWRRPSGALMSERWGIYQGGFGRSLLRMLGLPGLNLSCYPCSPCTKKPCSGNVEGAEAGARVMGPCPNPCDGSNPALGHLQVQAWRNRGKLTVNVQCDEPCECADPQPRAVTFACFEAPDGKSCSLNVFIDGWKGRCVLSRPIS